MTDFERCGGCVETIRTQCDVYRNTAFGAVDVLATATQTSVERNSDASNEVIENGLASVNRMISSAALRIGQIGCEHDTQTIIQQLREA